MTDPQTSFSTDVAIELLAHPIRRRALQYLIEAEGAVTLDDITAGVAAPEAGLSPDGAKISLYHNHLPKLAGAGVIEFDPDRQVVSYRGADLLEDLLEVSGRAEE